MKSKNVDSRENHEPNHEKNQKNLSNKLSQKLNHKLNQRLARKLSQNLTRKLKYPIQLFLKMEAASGILLIVFTILALFLANSFFAETYFYLLDIKVFSLSIHHWVNDGLMTLFFFVIGMEIKKEIVIGELSSRQKAALPIAAALGGMVFPALIYLFFNQKSPQMNGWGIPMATDIAFAVGVLSLFGKRIPLSLKVFLLALAIVDDLGAVLVIAFFYTAKISGLYLGLAFVGLSLLVLCKKLKFSSYWIYFCLSIFIWLFVLRSGVHATIAGVLIGLLTPLHFPKPPDPLKSRLNFKASETPLEDLIHYLHPWMSFVIMPIFALANAGVSLKQIDLPQALQNSIFYGVSFGLLFGKPLGIMIFSAIAVFFKIAILPSGTKWSHLFAVSCLAGIGFTMALFVTNLSLPADLLIYAKIAILSASFLAAIVGYFVLSYSISQATTRPPSK